ncbi:MAG: putative Ig domain-containing protein [Fidelibacterota bacterium]
MTNSFDRSITLRVVFLILSLFTLKNLWAQVEAVVSLSDTYDFDGDGLSEFLAVEKTDPQASRPSRATYTEIDDRGTHTELWRFTSPSPIKDARIADVDGDGAPEVVVARETGGLGSRDTTEPWLYLFPWSADHFSPDPQIQWSGWEYEGNLRLSHFTILDIDSDGKDEIVLALGSPQRELFILRFDPRSDSPPFQVSSLPAADAISAGYGQIYLASVDHNQDGYPDLIAINRELTTLKIQVFQNEGGDLEEGPVYEHPVDRFHEYLSGVIPSAITSVDTDRDGRNEIFFPFQAGPALSIEIEPDRVVAAPVQPDVTSLFTFPRQGVNDLQTNEILLARAEMGITGLKARKLKLEAIETRPTEAEEVPAEAAPPSPARRVKRLELQALEPAAEEQPSKEITGAPGEPTPTLPEEVTTPQQPGAETAVTAAAAEEEAPPETGPQPAGEKPVTAPRLPTRVRKLELESLTREAKATPAVPPSLTIPPGVEIADTVLTGERYVHSLEVGEGERLHAFRPRELPSGASFDPSTRMLTWTPTETQPGLHKLTYDVEVELTGRVGLQETEETVQVLARTETKTVELYILVLAPQKEE